MDDVKSYFQDINSEYNILKKHCDDEKQLKKFVKRLFPIFEELPIGTVAITLSEDDPFHFGSYYVENYLGLYVEFRYRDRKRVIEWFLKSKYSKYEIFELGASTYLFYFRISELLNQI